MGQKDTFDTHWTLVVSTDEAVSTARIVSNLKLLAKTAIRIATANAEDAGRCLGDAREAVKKLTGNESQWTKKGVEHDLPMAVTTARHANEERTKVTMTYIDDLLKEIKVL